MTPQETFVTRLRRHRQRNQISLDEIAAATRVKRELLEGLENNDLAGWPQGLYARAWIRAYAAVVGLDPNDTVDEFCRLYPHGDRRARGTIKEIAAIVAAPSEYQDEFPHPERRRMTDAPPDLEPWSPASVESAPVVISEPPTPWHASLMSALRPLWLRLTSIGPTPKSLGGGMS